MQAQGSSLLNATYYASLTAQADAISTCAELQAFADQVMASLQAEVTAIQNQISALLPLTTLPTDLGSVITWITNLANPYIKAYENYTSQLEQVLSAISSLTAAIEAAAAKIESCAVSVASIA